MALKAEDIIKVQLDFFYSRPKLVAAALMCVDDAAHRQILKECKERGIDIGPHIQTLIDRQLRVTKILRSIR